MTKLRVAIAGAAGYTGGEIIRILMHHPRAEIIEVISSSQAGKSIDSVHSDLLGETDLKFSSTFSKNCDVLFLCMAHGESRNWLASHSVPDTARIIDLSQDFRFHAKNNLGDREFIYGLPELGKNQIIAAKNIANPGCFATAILLALLPLAAHGLLHADVHVSATTGSTGAGVGLSDTSHFSWRNNNLSFYKAFSHQHLAEIDQSVKYLQPDFAEDIHFIPYRGSFTRGIFACCYTNIKSGLREVQSLYESYYHSHPFVHLSKKNIDLKQVVNTNKSVLYLEKHKQNLLIAVALDNLLKGASGQAVQNMNLMFGLDETSGLQWKSSTF